MEMIKFTWSELQVFEINVERWKYKVFRVTGPSYQPSEYIWKTVTGDKKKKYHGTKLNSGAS